MAVGRCMSTSLLVAGKQNHSTEVGDVFVDVSGTRVIYCVPVIARRFCCHILARAREWLPSGDLLSAEMDLKQSPWEKNVLP